MVVVGILTTLMTPPELFTKPVDKFSSTLASLIVSDQLRSLTFQQSKALSVAAIFRARQMNADTLGSLPLKQGSVDNLSGIVTETILSLQDFGEAYWQINALGDIRVLDNSPMFVAWTAGRYADRKRVYTYEGRLMRTDGINPNLYVLSLNRRTQDLVGNGPMQSGRIAGLIEEHAYSK